MTNAELRAAIGQHLREHQGQELTAFEIARGLGLNAQTGQTRVRNALRAMKTAGEVRCTESPRGGDDPRPVFRWTAAEGSL